MTYERPTSKAQVATNEQAKHQHSVKVVIRNNASIEAQNQAKARCE